jgi:hypothetical protein
MKAKTELLAETAKGDPVAEHLDHPPNRRQTHPHQSLSQMVYYNLLT